MPKAYSGDLRVWVIEMVQAGASRREAAEEFSRQHRGQVAAAVGRQWQRRGETARRQCLAAGGACDVDPGGGARAT